MIRRVAELQRGFELDSAVPATTPLQWRFACFRNQPPSRSLEQSCSVLCRPRALTGRFGDPGSAMRLLFRIKLPCLALRSPCTRCLRKRCRIRGVPTGQRFHNAVRDSPFEARADGTFTGSTAAAAMTRRSIASSRTKKLRRLRCMPYVSWPRSSGRRFAENVEPR
jgi:hypothetical protein